MKKILYVITKSNFGGAQRYVYDLATSLPRSDFDVAVVHGDEGILSEKLRSAGIRTISIPFLERDIRMLSEIRTLWTLIRLFQKERPDVVHLNSSKIGGLGSLAGRLARVPKIVFTAHGWHYKEDRSSFTRAATRFLSWLTALFSHRIIVVSDDDARHAPRLFVSHKIVRIHNGIPDDMRVLSRSAARRKVRSFISHTGYATHPDGGKAAIGVRGASWVGTISELHSNKGLSYAIDAVADLHASGTEILFFIIGEGKGREEYEAMVHKHRLMDTVFFLGFVKNASSLLSAFDIFTLTSTKEGLPYSLLEAGASGCAVIASAVGGIPEIVSDMETGVLTRPKDTGEITKSLRYLTKNAPRRRDFGAGLQRHVAKHFTARRMLAETLLLYR